MDEFSIPEVQEQITMGTIYLKTTILIPERNNCNDKLWLTLINGELESLLQRDYNSAEEMKS